MKSKKHKNDSDEKSFQRLIKKCTQDPKIGNIAITWRIVIINGITTPYEINNLGTCVRDKNSKKSLHIVQHMYPFVNLRIDGKNYPKNIHRLVAEAFIPNPENKPQVNHINGIKNDNRVNNLEWVTAKENKQHAINSGLDNPKHGHQVRGIESGVSKYTEEQVHEICKLIEDGLKDKEISKLMQVHPDFPRSIRRKISWRHISDNYKFNNKYELLQNSCEV